MIDTFEISAKNLSNLVVDETQEKFQMILMKVASGKLININFAGCKLLKRFILVYSILRNMAEILVLLLCLSGQEMAPTGGTV